MGGSVTGVKDPGGSLLFYKWAFACSAWLCFAHYRMRVFGRRRIPRTGAFILASNHQSFFDPLVLGVSSRRPLAYFARRSLFSIPVFSRAIANLNAIPVPRGSFSPDALKRALAALRQGWPLVVFPEGTRTRDGRVRPLRRGIGLLAARSGAPVLPARIAGAFAVWPRHLKFPRISGEIAVAFGPLLVYDSRTDTYDSFAARVSRAFADLAGHLPASYRNRDEKAGERWARFPGTVRSLP